MAQRTFGMDLLNGFGTFATALADEIVKDQTRQYELAERKRKESERERMEQDHKILLDSIFGKKEETKVVETPEKEDNTVLFVYSVEHLNKMSTKELREEVYSIYKENDSLFTDGYKNKGKEAYDLYYKRGLTDIRYRAMLIKFLVEKGNI